LYFLVVIFTHNTKIRGQFVVKMIVPHLYSLHYPICSVPDAAANCQHDSGAAKRGVLEFPDIETDCCNTKDYANYSWNHFHQAFQFSAIL
jgi:hypothetical protein